MNDVTDYPLLVFVLSFFALWLSTRIGASLHRRQRNPDQDANADYDIVLAATLTLLGLIIGFSFSMATSRYDQRKNYEAAEANIIGTEYVRVDLLPAADGAKLRALLRYYLDQRVLFYTDRRTFFRTAMKNRTGRLMPVLLNCRPSCGPRSGLPPLHSRLPLLHWPFWA